MTALCGLRDTGALQAEQKVLVNGAAGGVGTFAVQIARSLGAEVAGVCSASNVDMVRSIGADRVIDYTSEDFTRSGEKYDLMLDCIGNHPLSACGRILTPTGTYAAVGGPNGRWIGPLAPFIKTVVLSPFVRQGVRGVMPTLNTESLATMEGLVASGKVTPVIDRRYTLSDVPDALRYLEQGHARGKVVIIVCV